MKNRYNKIMEKVEVTDEIRARILNNISNLDFEKTFNNTIYFHNYKKYISIAACFVFLIFASVIIHNPFNSPSEPPAQTAPDIISYQSIDELSDAIGFKVKKIKKLPFDIESVNYVSYPGNLADIKYVGLNNTAAFRMSAGNEDISGYYDEFKNVEKHEVNGYDVTIKGNNSQYILAIWHNDGFSYSLQFTEPVSKQEMLDTIQSIK